MPVWFQRVLLAALVGLLLKWAWICLTEHGKLLERHDTLIELLAGGKL